MGKGHRRCEVCGMKEAWQTGNKLLFSSFPLDVNRCREWLKAVGNEELVYLPIEKLHQQRNICAKHFNKKDFNKQGNRLKRHAIPTVDLVALPLTDGQLSEFPQHVYGHSESKGAPCEANILSDSTSHPESPDEPMSESTAILGSAPERAFAVVPETTSTPTFADVPPIEHVSMESIQEFEPDILCLFGEETVYEEKFGENVHKDIASRWTDILVNGLKDETKKDIMKNYSIPHNLKFAETPTINPEIRAAVSAGALKRDNILSDKQEVLTSIINCVANTITVLQTGSCDEEIKRQTIKSLGDAGRLLCHSHYSETQTRRNFLLSCFNKEIKDNVKDLKRDHLLFGNDLKENLKSLKAIIRTGKKLKPTAAKPKLPPKNSKPKKPTSRALNRRGPPPPQS